MGVRIEPIAESCRIRVTGDIETTVSVPFEDDDRFMIGLSDGTLLVGSYDDALRCQFDVARFGAGLVRVEQDAVIVDWRGIEWAAVSTYDANVVEPPEPAPLPLLDRLDLLTSIN